jgi:hypothetical protein
LHSGTLTKRKSTKHTKTLYFDGNYVILKGTAFWRENISYKPGSLKETINFDFFCNFGILQKMVYLGTFWQKCFNFASKIALSKIFCYISTKQIMLGILAENDAFKTNLALRSTLYKLGVIL